MKAPVFVCASAGLFASWLAVTYVRAVPSEQYPALGRGSQPLSAQREAKPAKPLISLQEKRTAPVAGVK
jgi:hypothetical protein